MRWVVFSAISVPWQRFCCFCNWSQENLKADLPSSNFSLRTSERYDNNVLNINADKTLSSIYGIKGNSSVNCCQYYHVINGPPPDIAHDIFEGFATDFLQKLLFHTNESLDTRNNECSNKLFQLLSY